MGTVRIHQGRFEIDGRPFYPIGVNYAPRYICTNFWEDWRPQVIRQDIRVMAEAAFNAIRIPVIWQTAEPAPGQYSPDFTAQFDEFLRWCGEAGIYVMPWFLVGVSTGMYDVAWRSGRSFLKGEMLELAAKHLAHFTGRLRGDPRILCWDICDEPEFYSNKKYFPGSDPLPYAREVVNNYTRTLANAIRAADDTHVVTLGFSHICSENWGINVRDVVEPLDAVSVTGYPFYAQEPIDGFRNGYFIAWMTRFQRIAGKHVFLGEAPGFHTAGNAEDVVANYVKVSTLSSLAAGSLGVIPWVYSDYIREIHEKWPLDYQPHEPCFGFWRADGSRKPSADVLIDIGRTLHELPITDYQLPPAQAAMLVPETYYDTLPRNFHSSFMGYVLARMAGFQLDYLWERDVTAAALDRYKLLIMPGCSKVCLPAWYHLQEWVQRGGTLLLTFANGVIYYPDFANLFGLSIRGVVPGPGAASATMAADWHSLKAGTVLAPLPLPASCPLWRPQKAQLLAAYADARPFLTANRFGQGHAIACAHSLEAAFFDPAVYNRWRQYPGWRLYRAAAAAAGIAPAVLSDDPCVEAHLFHHRSGHSKLLMLLNHLDELITTTVQLRDARPSLTVLHADAATIAREDNLLHVSIPAFTCAWIRFE